MSNRSKTSSNSWAPYVAATVGLAATAMGMWNFFGKKNEGGSEHNGPVEPHKDMPRSLKAPPKELAEKLQIAIVRTAWNESMVLSMQAGAEEAMIKSGLPKENIHVEVVPGAYEIPICAKYLAQSGKYNVVLTLGVLINGETAHFEYISSAVSQALMHVQIQTNVPVLYGVLNCFTEGQAIARTRAGSDLPGSLGVSALHMAEVQYRLAEESKEQSA
eukprot:CAMPEP_0174296936 /NCGR_PEP_ID=MMETSP0809-20121228/49424_1 /TAXON_ID=73025 ORGANISM="Eutreptiella gymnastica-like, Strain CCMP1594" /NCGR_SAMPLE_ID=MMETSP0809 /ASSEMBLY_ACC=CAM_ASM_000658 /LENGTH=216 /DNA_ID=CAMNT_0015400309 /DNA_START=13 /DNA_END=663 /DNA_ORIENTATION=-